eukprot:Rhum_TRINITY_DN14822_c5_g1::Rhum_TRINITY_DN14822_c5_g1_i1::g.121788::m.121788
MSFSLSSILLICFICYSPFLPSVAFVVLVVTTTTLQDADDEGEGVHDVQQHRRRVAHNVEDAGVRVLDHAARVRRDEEREHRQPCVHHQLVRQHRRRHEHREQLHTDQPEQTRHQRPLHLHRRSGRRHHRRSREPGERRPRQPHGGQQDACGRRAAGDVRGTHAEQRREAVEHAEPCGRRTLLGHHAEKRHEGQQAGRPERDGSTEGREEHQTGARDRGRHAGSRVAVHTHQVLACHRRQRVVLGRTGGLLDLVRLLARRLHCGCRGLAACDDAAAQARRGAAVQAGLLRLQLPRARRGGKGAGGPQRGGGACRDEARPHHCVCLFVCLF